MSDRFRVVPLGAHERTTFDCGVEPLDRYLKTLATQDIRRRVSNCFVALDFDDAIAGYYTFAATSILFLDLPEDATKRLPRYPTVPAALIGRLAVDKRYQSRRLGEALLADAVLRARQSAPAIFALVVDAKDERAAHFYRRFQFRPLRSRASSFFLTVASTEKILLRG
jgi:ribosomal protein S18 acetylase RimI-like enzyme